MTIIRNNLTLCVAEILLLRWCVEVIIMRDLPYNGDIPID